MRKACTILTALAALLVLFSLPYQIGAEGHVEEVKSNGIKMAVDVMTAEEHHKMMEMMKMQMMEMDPEATHHLSVTLIDEATGQGIKEAGVQIICLSQEGQEVENKNLMFMPGMNHFGGGITLSKGKFYVKVLVTLKDGFKYTTTFPFVVP